MADPIRVSSKSDSFLKNSIPILDPPITWSKDYDPHIRAQCAKCLWKHVKPPYLHKKSPILQGCVSSSCSVWPCHSNGRGWSGVMRRFAKVDEEDDFIWVRWTKLRKPCHRLGWQTGVDAQEAKEPGRMCYGKLSSFNRVVNAQLSN